MKIILASGSPRRKQLLELAGIDAGVLVTNADETAMGTPEEQVRELSLRKLECAIEMGTKASHFDGSDVTLPANASLDAGRVTSPPFQHIIIAADTLVYINGEVLAKPESPEEAFDMLKKLEGKKHTVYTGVAIGKLVGCYSETYVFASSTDVYFRSLTDDEILAYIKTGEPFDKAGAYGVQEKGALLVEKVVGDFYTVVGLPLAKVCKVLTDMGVDVWKV